MKTITRRLRKLEERFAPQVSEEDSRLAEILRERLRRYSEARGEPFDVPTQARVDRDRRGHNRSLKYCGEGSNGRAPGSPVFP